MLPNYLLQYKSATQVKLNGSNADWLKIISKQIADNHSAFYCTANKFFNKIFLQTFAAIV